MAGFSQFEEIEAWQKARILSQKVHEITKQAKFRDDYDLKRQIKKCAGSIMDNIAEGLIRYLLKSELKGPKFKH